MLFIVFKRWGTRPHRVLQGSPRRKKVRENIDRRFDYGFYRKEKQHRVRRFSIGGLKKF